FPARAAQLWEDRADGVVQGQRAAVDQSQNRRQRCHHFREGGEIEDRVGRHRDARGLAHGATGGAVQEDVAAPGDERDGTGVRALVQTVEDDAPGVIEPIRAAFVLDGLVSSTVADPVPGSRRHSGRHRTTDSWPYRHLLPQRATAVGMCLWGASYTDIDEGRGDVPFQAGSDGAFLSAPGMIAPRS
ncbi:MAG: hypothetical protein QOF33_1883, partial [Thermomicrobiales bacterium]|nr:hypothetical protein [Thermomicrobiales bacterium]